MIQIGPLLWAKFENFVWDWISGKTPNLLTLEKPHNVRLKICGTCEVCASPFCMLFGFPIYVFFSLFHVFFLVLFSLFHVFFPFTSNFSPFLLLIPLFPLFPIFLYFRFNLFLFYLPLIFLFQFHSFFYSYPKSQFLTAILHRGLK